MEAGVGKWSKASLEEIRSMLQAATPETKKLLIAELRLDARKGVHNLLKQVERQMEKEAAERKRLALMWERERQLYSQGYQLVAGLDEAGRGPLAGPVVAACVILPPECDLPGLNDSKKLKAEERQRLAALIKEQALAWSVGVVDHQEIDRINILQATKQAMLAALGQMSRRPHYLLIDALQLETDIPQEGIIHGDSLSASIAAASILAKTFRDELMEAVDLLYPEYGFAEHKGYGTPRHYEALRRWGPCPIHRKTFVHWENDN